MVKTMKAIFDGKVLKPEEPIELAPNTSVEITIRTPEPVMGSPGCSLQVAMSLNLEGPSDWSERIEDELELPG
jgi:predicted DNA-binding antitoxin AbrB/MazE fold protein